MQHFNILNIFIPLILVTGINSRISPLKLSNLNSKAQNFLQEIYNADAEDSQRMERELFETILSEIPEIQEHKNKGSGNMEGEAEARQSFLSGINSLISWSNSNSEKGVETRDSIGAAPASTVPDDSVVGAFNKLLGWSNSDVPTTTPEPPETTEIEEEEVTETPEVTEREKEVNEATEREKEVTEETEKEAATTKDPNFQSSVSGLLGQGGATGSGGIRLGGGVAGGVRNVSGIVDDALLVGLAPAPIRLLVNGILSVAYCSKDRKEEGKC